MSHSHPVRVSDGACQRRSPLQEEVGWPYQEEERYP